MTRLCRFAATSCLVFVAGRAGADEDIARRTMGRTTNPAGGFSLQVSPELTFPSSTDSSRDWVHYQVAAKFGWTDRWTFELGMSTAHSRRDRVSLDKLDLKASWMALELPFQLTPSLVLRPDVGERDVEGEFDIQFLQLFGPVSWLLIAQLEFDHALRGAVFDGEIGFGPSYRFGLNGMAGMALEAVSNGGWHAHISLGGRISHNLFLSIAPEIGLNRKSDAFTLNLQLTYYTGPHRVAGLD